MVQRLKTYIGTRGHESSSQYYSEWLTAVCNSSSRGISFFWPLWATTHLHSPYSDTQLYIIQNNSINKSHGYAHMCMHTHTHQMKRMMVVTILVSWIEENRCDRVAAPLSIQQLQPTAYFMSLHTQTALWPSQVSKPTGCGWKEAMRGGRYWRRGSQQWSPLDSSWIVLFFRRIWKFETFIFS